MPKEREPKRLETILKEYEIHLKAKEIRNSKYMVAQLNLFFCWCEDKGIDPLSLTETKGRDWLVFLMEGEKSLCRSTVNRKISRVRGFYSFLQRRRYIPDSPWFYIESLKESKTLPRGIPTPKEIESLIVNFSILSLGDEMLKVIIEILYGSGLRISEVEALRCDDIDWAGGSLTIFEKKTQRQRKVPATGASLMAINRYMGEFRETLLTPVELAGDYLFSQQGETTLRTRINRRLKRECDRLNIPSLTSHSFRHSVATHMLKAGAGIRQVQSFLGHKSITSTEIYTHLIKEDLKEVIHSHHPREQRRKKA